MVMRRPKNAGPIMVIVLGAWLLMTFVVFLVGAFRLEDASAVRAWACVTLPILTAIEAWLLPDR